jgi:hypothetical protein
VTGAASWDWSLRLFDHVDLRADKHAESVRFYEAVLAPLGIPRLSQCQEGTCFTNLNVADQRPSEPGLHQRGQLGDVVLGQVGQGSH